MALLVGNEDNAFHGILCAWNLSGESKIQQKKYIRILIFNCEVVSNNLKI
jgi:hypothetical protein